MQRYNACMSDVRLPSTTPYLVSSPLWSRAPARDEHGKPYSDFMMLIPGLKSSNEDEIVACLYRIRQGLVGFEEVVVYVDLNVRLSLLWVSIRPLPGISSRIVQAIQREIPQAKVIAGDFNPETKPDSRFSLNRLARFSPGVKRRLKLIALTVVRSRNK